MRRSRFPATVVLLAGMVSVSAVVCADTVASFSFDQLSIGVNNAPAPAVGAGTLASIGMTNGFTSPASVANCDVLSQSGTSNPNAGNQTWRIRGGGTGSGNGWAAAAPQYTQGLEALVGTAGFSDIVLTYDWSSTTQGVKHQQVQYTVDGNSWSNIGPIQTAGATEAWINGITIDFSAVSAADNNPLFGVRIVSAIAPDGPNAGQYVNLAGNPINSTSGNWRVDSLLFSGTAIPEPAAGTALLMGLAMLLCGRRHR